MSLALFRAFPPPTSHCLDEASRSTQDPRFEKPGAWEKLEDVLFKASYLGASLRDELEVIERAFESLDAAGRHRLLEKKRCDWAAVFSRMERLGREGNRAGDLHERLGKLWQEFEATRLVGLITISKGLIESGIPFQFLKGAGDQLIGNFSLRRSFIDIDILVPRDAAGSVEDIFCALGYRKFLPDKTGGNPIFFSRSDVRMDFEVEVYLENYGVFPMDFPLPIYSVGMPDCGKNRVRLLLEEWLADGLVRPQDQNDLRFISEHYYKGDYGRLVSEIEDPILRAIARKLVADHMGINLAQCGTGSRILSRIAGNFIRNRGARPLLGGAHWIRMMVLHRRIKRDYGNRMALVETCKYLTRLYLTKLRLALHINLRLAALVPCYAKRDREAWIKPTGGGA